MIGNHWNTCMYFLTANVMKCHESLQHLVEWVGLRINYSFVLGLVDMTCVGSV